MYKRQSRSFPHQSSNYPANGDIALDDSSKLLGINHIIQVNPPSAIRPPIPPMHLNKLEEIKPIEYIIPSDGIGKYTFEIYYEDKEGHEEHFISEEFDVSSDDNGQSKIVNSELTHLYDDIRFGLTNSIPITNESTGIEFSSDFTDPDGTKSVIPKKLIFNDNDIELLDKQSNQKDTNPTKGLLITDKGITGTSKAITSFFQQSLYDKSYRKGFEGFGTSRNLFQGYPDNSGAGKWNGSSNHWESGHPRYGLELWNYDLSLIHI